MHVFVFVRLSLSLSLSLSLCDRLVRQLNTKETTEAILCTMHIGIKNSNSVLFNSLILTAILINEHACKMSVG